MMHLALVHHGNDAQTAMKQYLLESYFTRGEDITSDDVLIAAAGAAGISPETAREWLVSNEGDQEVRADISRAGELGITAVPTFVFDDTWAIPGAQDVEVFERVLRRLAEKSLSKP
jgi:predicted DsbA family dithiol-disulfide isomerase